MSYDILAVRDVDAPADARYPTPGELPDSVALDRADEPTGRAIVVPELAVSEVPPGGLPRRLLRVRDVKATVLPTASRLVVACSKYEKGGGWTPWTPAALPVTLAANAISKRAAAKRRSGKMLVGHVPYPWMLSVGVRPRETRIGRDCLRIGTVDHSQQTYRGLLLDITLPRQEDAAALACELAVKVARYRLAHQDDELDEADRERLEGLRQPPPLQLEPKQFSSYFFVDTTQSDIATAYTHA